MRFYDKDIVAARPNPAVMPFGPDRNRRFVAAMGYLQAQFHARPALLIHVLTAKRCSLAARPSTENLIILASPVPAGSERPQRQIHHCCHGTGGRQRHSRAVHRLPNYPNSHIKNFAEPRTDPVGLQYGLEFTRLDWMDWRTGEHQSV